MNIQDVVNLEFLRRATTSDLPLAERQVLQETLGFALAGDQSASDWVFGVINALAGHHAPDEMLLWILDWVESQPADQLGANIGEGLARLWNSADSELVRTRLLDVLTNIEVRPSREGAGQASPIAEIFASEMRKEVLRTGDILLILDFVLMQQDASHFFLLLSILQADKSFARLEPVIRAHVFQRFSRLSPSLQDAVQRAFDQH